MDPETTLESFRIDVVHAKRRIPDAISQARSPLTPRQVEAALAGTPKEAVSWACRELHREGVLRVAWRVRKGKNRVRLWALKDWRKGP